MTFNYSFDSNTGHVTIAGGSTEIPPNAFKWRKDVKSVSIPDSVTSIGVEAFRESGLTKVVIPNSVISIPRLCIS